MSIAVPEAVRRTHAYQRTLDQAEAEKSARENGGHPRVKVVDTVIWVCPSPGCADYYAAGGSGDLTSKHTGVKVEDKHLYPASTSRVGEVGMRHNRAECPSCRLRGVHVDRVPVGVLVEVAVRA